MKLLEQVHQNLFKDKAVIAAALMGSAAREQQDEWSDLDILVILDGESRMQWREMPIFGLEEHSSPESRTVHTLYEDMQIIDFVLIEAKVLAEKPSILQQFQAKPLKILFSKNEKLLSLLQESHPHAAFKPMNEEAFAEFQLRFWYQARYALQRILRDDLLIGLHLALGLFQQLLVLRMIIRDRETGRNYHRSGGSGNNYVKQLDISLASYSAESILDLIAVIVSEFDALGQQFSSSYKVKKAPMLELIERIKLSLPSAQSH